MEPTFFEWCIDERDCFAYFRDLVPGPANYEQGEFSVPLVDMFVKEGRSDLAIVKLAYQVNLVAFNSQANFEFTQSPFLFRCNSTLTTIWVSPSNISTWPLRSLNQATWPSQRHTRL